MTIALDDETLDDLLLTGRKILQKRRGYRFSIDPVLLSGFVSRRNGERVADLGTGSGVLPLLLAGKGETQIVGIERQPELAEMARRSVELNRLEQSIAIVCADLRDCRRNFPPQSFDLVVSNPPYRVPGSGRQAPDPQRSAARHEQAGDLDDFLRAAAYLLSNRGRCALVYLAERLTDLLVGLRAVRIEPKRLRLVHPRPGEPGKLALVEGVRAGRPGLAVEPPLYVFGEGEEYSDEVLGWYRGVSPDPGPAGAACRRGSGA